MTKKHIIIIPAIDIRAGRCVRLIQGDYSKETVYSDNPAAQALIWQNQGAEYLHLVDLDGAKEGRPVNLKSVREITKAIKIPCELGGGIRTIEDAEKTFEAGIQRIILGTAACENLEFVVELIGRFSAERIVVGIDAKNGKVSVRGWVGITDTDPCGLASRAEKMGVGRFIYTDISTDGMLAGPNLDSLAAFCDAVPSAKVIASGGVSSISDARNIANLAKPNIEGIIIGKALYEKQISLPELIKSLA